MVKSSLSLTNGSRFPSNCAGGRRDGDIKTLFTSCEDRKHFEEILYYKQMRVNTHCTDWGSESAQFLNHHFWDLLHAEWTRKYLDTSNATVLHWGSKSQQAEGRTGMLEKNLMKLYQPSFQEQEISLTRLRESEMLQLCRSCSVGCSTEEN